MKIEDIIENYTPVTETGCFLWLSGASKAGYGNVRYKGKMINAHRVVWMHYNHDVSPNISIRHKCDNPLCININHLEAGTHADNMRDKVKRNRCYHPAGIKNGRAKLTEAQVKEIYHSPLRQIDLSEKFNIDQTVISDIKTRKIWKHIEV